MGQGSMRAVPWVCVSPLVCGWVSADTDVEDAHKEEVAHIVAHVAVSGLLAAHGAQVCVFAEVCVVPYVSEVWVLPCVSGWVGADVDRVA